MRRVKLIALGSFRVEWSELKSPHCIWESITNLEHYYHVRLFCRKVWCFGCRKYSDLCMQKQSMAVFRARSNYPKYKQLCFMLWFLYRFLCSSCAIRGNWLSRLAKNTNASANTCPAWKLLFSLVACKSRRTSRCWRATVRMWSLALLVEFWRSSKTNRSSLNTWSISFWTSVTKCSNNLVCLLLNQL